MGRERNSRQAALAAVVSILMVGLAATAARAQGFGIGPRMVFVSASDSTAQAATAPANTRFTGAFVRLRTGTRLALEASFDYRSTMNTAQTERVRSTPIQGSVLYYPIRSDIQPYLVGGIGWYRERYETLNGGVSTSTVDSSKVGYHAGIGGELMLGRRASIFVDYRYTFINLGIPGGAASAAATAVSALTSVTGLLSMGDSLGLSHKGSMWTTGMTVYF